MATTAIAHFESQIKKNEHDAKQWKFNKRNQRDKRIQWAKEQAAKEAEKAKEAAELLQKDEVVVDEEDETDEENDYTDQMMFKRHGDRGEPEQYDRKVKTV